MGLALAHQLARKGKNVEVLSRRRSEAAGFVAAGMIAPHAEGLSGELLKIGRLSLELIPEWVNSIEIDSGISCGMRRSGIVVPFFTDHERDSYPTAQFGQPLNRFDLEQQVAGIGSSWRAGLLFEQDGQLDNRRRLMRALEKACVGRGVHFQEGVEVLELLNNADHFEGVKISNAEGDLKVIKAHQAILCCGAWSGKLLHELPIFPVKGQMFSLQAPKDALTRVVFGPGTYLVPREDGLIVVGATSERDAGFMEGLTPAGQKQLFDGMASLLPESVKWPPMERWWGFRPCTPDNAPLLGESSISGLWLATGHHRNGVLLAAITAQMISNSLIGDHLNSEFKVLIDHFRWDRFKNLLLQ